MTVTVNFAMQGVDAASDPSMIRLSSMRGQDGRLLVWEITLDQGRRQPRWNVEAGGQPDWPPPLSMADHTRLGLAWLQNRNPDIQRFELQNVILSRSRRPPDVDFWYCQVDFVGYGTTRTVGSLVRAVILPDGSIVEPRIEPTLMGARASAPDRPAALARP